jgi:nitrate reductase alpha subunit
MCDDVYDEMLEDNHFPYKYDGKTCPRCAKTWMACNAVLTCRTLTNGKLNVRAYENMEKKTGLKLADLGEGSKDVRIDYEDLQAQPRRYNTSPLWSGLMNNGRAYCAYTYNVRQAGALAHAHRPAALLPRSRAATSRTASTCRPTSLRPSPRRTATSRRR